MDIQALMMITADVKETQDLVTLVPWTFIIQIINLFIQVYLIKKFLFKPINDILEKRKNLADKTIREAREAQDKADSLKEQYESSLTKAHAEAADIVSGSCTAPYRMCRRQFLVRCTRRNTSLRLHFDTQCQGFAVHSV